MPSPPRVSVLMTTYNGAGLIRESIDSILAQTLTDFEFVIVDDGSTDETPAILASYGDPRLRAFRTPQNLGIVGARNFGFALCRGAYVAALDHDDLSTSDRLAVQAAYLDANPGIVLAGSEILISENGALRETDHEPGATPPLVRWMLHVDNPLTWSSIMLRREAVERLGVFMRAGYEPADDFDLYHRLLALGDIARLDAPLAIYRWHQNNVSHSRGDQLLAAAAAILAPAYAPWLGAGAEEAARLAARYLSSREPPPDAATLRRLGEVLERLLAGFCAGRRLDAGAGEGRDVAGHAAQLWWRLVRSTVRAGTPGAITQYRTRPALRHGFTPAPRDMLESVAIGALRATSPTRRLLAALRPS
jgi:hypothetical protein